MLFIYILVSILAGITIVLARMINSKLAEIIGTLQGTLVNYIVGLSVSILIYLLSNEGSILDYSVYHLVPLWAYLGGLVGVIVIVSSNYITPKISTFSITLLIFIGQLFIGIFIDYLLLGELSLGKVLGGFFVLMGLAYNLWIDKKSVEVLKR